MNLIRSSKFTIGLLIFCAFIWGLNIGNWLTRADRIEAYRLGRKAGHGFAELRYADTEWERRLYQDCIDTMRERGELWEEVE